MYGFFYQNFVNNVFDIFNLATINNMDITFSESYKAANSFISASLCFIQEDMDNDFGIKFCWTVHPRYIDIQLDKCHIPSGKNLRFFMRYEKSPWKLSPHPHYLTLYDITVRQRRKAVLIIKTKYFEEFEIIIRYFIKICYDYYICNQDEDFLTFYTNYFKQ